MAELSELDVNMPEDVWIYDNKQGSEYVSYNTLSLYKLINTYLVIFRNGQRSKMERFGKIIIVFDIFAKHSILRFWEGSEYVSGFKYTTFLYKQLKI